LARELLHPEPKKVKKHEGMLVFTDGGKRKSAYALEKEKMIIQNFLS